MAAHPANPRPKGLLTREKEKEREKQREREVTPSAGVARTTAAAAAAAGFSPVGVICTPRRGVDI